MDYWQPHRV